MKNLSVTIPLSDAETITISGTLTEFDILNQADSGSRQTIGRFKRGRWLFDTPYQERLFFNLFDAYRETFYLAVEFFKAQVGK